MYGLSLGGRSIVPIRAVPFASGSDISPLAIALAVGDRHQFIDEREYCTELTGYWLDSRVTAHPMLTAEFARTLETVGRLAHAGAATDAQIAELPPRVFFYRDDLETFLQEFNARRVERPSYGPGRAPAQLSEWPCVSTEHERLMLEGFERLHAAVVGLPSTGGIRAIRDAELERIMDDLERAAAGQGIPFDRARMPGRAADLIDLVRRNSRQLRSLSDEVIHKDYFRAAGINFRPGRRTKGEPAHPLYKLM